MDEPRYCSNCRAEIPDEADSCPACGVYAGDIFDGRLPRKPSHIGLWLTLLILAIVAAGASVWLTTTDRPLPWQKERVKVDTAPPPPVRVVGDRPGGARRAAESKINEAEAIRLLRRHLITTMAVKSECLAVMSDGFRGKDYIFAAFNHCESTRLGRWRVDGVTGDVGRAK